MYFTPPSPRRIDDIEEGIPPPQAIRLAAREGNPLVVTNPAETVSTKEPININPDDGTDMIRSEMSEAISKRKNTLEGEATKQLEVPIPETPDTERSVFGSEQTPLDSKAKGKAVESPAAISKDLYEHGIHPPLQSYDQTPPTPQGGGHSQQGDAPSAALPPHMQFGQSDPKYVPDQPSEGLGVGSLVMDLQSFLPLASKIPLAYEEEPIPKYDHSFNQEFFAEKVTHKFGIKLEGSSLGQLDGEIVYSNLRMVHGRLRSNYLSDVLKLAPVKDHFESNNYQSVLYLVTGLLVVDRLGDSATHQTKTESRAIHIGGSSKPAATTPTSVVLGIEALRILPRTKKLLFTLQFLGEGQAVQQVADAVWDSNRSIKFVLMKLNRHTPYPARGGDLDGWTRINTLDVPYLAPR
jgi:hypothetical protein